MNIKSLHCENSYINLEEQFFKNNTTCTIMLWFNPDNISSEQYLISQISTRGGDDRFAVGIYDSKLTYYSGSNGFTYGAKVDKNKWYNLALVLNGLNLNIYVNGKLDCELNLTGFQDESTYLISYGITSGSSNYFYNGLISDFRIYDYMLSPEEIKCKMNLIETNYSHLLRYYNFGNITKDNKVIDLTGKKDVTVNNFIGLSDNVPLLKNLFKYLLKYKDDIYSIKSNLINLGQPKNKEELNLWFERYGESDLNILIQKLNNKSVPLINKGGIWESSAVNLNEVLTTIDLVENDEDKEIKYDVKPFRILDNFKGKIEILKRVEK